MKFKLMENLDFSIMVDDTPMDVNVKDADLRRYVLEFYTMDEITDIARSEQGNEVDNWTDKEKLDYIIDNLSDFEDVYYYVQECVEDEYADEALREYEDGINLRDANADIERDYLRSVL